MTGKPAVSVIIPTQGLRSRAKLLWRAIESVLGQDEVAPIPLVVLNGQETDPEVGEKLAAHPGIQVTHLEEASLPGSLRAGRASVETPWFSELDDDDVLLPGALASRVRALMDSPDADVVVSNGFRVEGTARVLHVDRMDDVAKDPLRALTSQNWLLPGSWLCRTGSVGNSLFAGMPEFLECTYLALQFSAHYRTVFLPEPSVEWFTDTPESASKSPAYLLAAPHGLRRILQLDLPFDVRREYRRRMAQALHDVAELHRASGQAWKAWRYHLGSLVRPGGFRYLPYTGRLLQHPFRHWS